MQNGMQQSSLAMLTSISVSHPKVTIMPQQDCWVVSGLKGLNLVTFAREAAAATT